MKKCRWITLCLLLALMLAACGGDVRQAELAVGPSELYTDAEIGDAMDVVLDHFRKEFDGCTLTWLGYDEAKVLAAQREWAAQYDADQAIVLLSDFEVDSFGGDGSLNPGGTYLNWQWILTRSGNGKWVLRTWGFG